MITAEYIQASTPLPLSVPTQDRIRKVVTYLHKVDAYASHYNIQRIRVARTPSDALGFTVQLHRPLPKEEAGKINRQLEPHGALSVDSRVIEVKSALRSGLKAWVRELAPQKPMLRQASRRDSGAGCDRTRLSAILCFAVSCPSELIQVGFDHQGGGMDMQLADPALAVTIHHYMRGYTAVYDGSIKIGRDRSEALGNVATILPGYQGGPEFYE